ncbi:MAG TPA: DUF3108 domain-containing protein [Gemmatimonadaceae bacterium]|nr:DUF3108 domain-containing protein [Gemmatimonadaceae bacterium]
MKPASLALAPLLLTLTSAPLAAQSPINIAALVSRTDSFVVMIQGNPLGFQRTTVERTETGLRMVDDVQIGPIMTQHTEVEFSTDGAMRSTKQTGQVRGQNTSIEIAYHDGRAKGSATTPSAAGLVTTAIDTTVVPGAVDDNLLTTVLPALAWSPTASITLPVFLSGKGYVQPVTLAVKGTEQLTVPAGTFDVYRVELSGGQAAVAMFVTTDSTHRLIKIAPRGAPLEFVLAK